LNLIKKLLSNGYEIYLLTKRDEYSCRVDHLFKKVYNLNIDLNGKRPIREIVTFFNILFVLLRLRPNYFLTFTIKPNLYGMIASFVTGTKVIPNITGLGSIESHQGIIASLTKFFYRVTCAFSYHVFFQNKDDMENFSLKSLNSEIKQLVLPGSGVDVKKFTPQNVKKRENCIKFIFLGRLLRKKGIIEYLQSARFIRKKHSEVKFFVLGFLDSENESCITYNELQPFIDDASVIYLGNTDEVDLVLPNYDCVVFPSYYFEGTPRSLIEAASCGLPIITTDSRGCKDVVDDNINGLICKSHDINSLIEKLNEFIILDHETRIEMGINSRNKALKVFNENIVLYAYTNIL
jgi:glycosyltransferase involved in cell wall biosynthesis